MTIHYIRTQSSANVRKISTLLQHQEHGRLYYYQKDSLSLSQKDSLLDVRLGCVNLLLSMELCVGVGVVICHIPAEASRDIEHFLYGFLLCSHPLP